MRSLWWAALLGAALRTAAFESCAEARRYYRADDLAEEARRLRAGRANVSRPLRFLHVPKNAGTTIQRLLPELRPRTTVVDGRTCGKCVKVGGPCACSLWHVPPRYLPRPSPYADHDTFCVARDPVDRVLSQWRMEGARRSACLVMRERLTHRCGAAMSDCHLWPQHEYVWDAAGRRTCAHVLAFDDLSDQFRRLMRAAGRDDVALPPVTSRRSALHHGAAAPETDLGANVTLMIRCAYKLDECLLRGRDIFEECARLDLTLDGWTRACDRSAGRKRRCRVHCRKRGTASARERLHKIS